MIEDYACSNCFCSLLIASLFFKQLRGWLDRYLIHQNARGHQLPLEVPSLYTLERLNAAFHRLALGQGAYFLPEMVVWYSNIRSLSRA
jgi:hypothetical protein